MATPPTARPGDTSTWDTVSLAVVGTLVALIGAMVGAWALSTGRPLAAAVLAPLIPGLFFANIALVIRAPRAAWFSRRGGALAAGVIGLSLALVAATVLLTRGCFGVSAASCVAVDGVPVFFVSLVAGLAELWTGFQVLYDWSGAAGRSGLRGALEGMAIALQGIGLLLELLAALGEFAIVPVLIILVALFLMSVVFGVPLWLMLVVLLFGIIVLGGLIGFVVGATGAADGRPGKGEAERPTPAAAPSPGSGLVWLSPGSGPKSPGPGGPPQPLPPMAAPLLSPQPMAPPPQPVLPPQPPPPSLGKAVPTPPLFCSRCGSPHILLALPPYRRVLCQTCGAESEY